MQKKPLILDRQQGHILQPKSAILSTFWATKMTVTCQLSPFTEFQWTQNKARVTQLTKKNRLAWHDRGGVRSQNKWPTLIFVRGGIRVNSLQRWILLSFAAFQILRIAADIG